MSNIILIGMPGCGKSTVGVILAKTLGMDFIDTDLLICKREHSTLQKIIETRGLDEFERIECEIGRDLRCENTVIATGGSMVLYAEAMENLRNMGKTVFIDVGLYELTHRIGNIRTRGITFKEGQTLRDIYSLRRPYYVKYADITVKVGNGTVEETVERILCEL